MKKSQYVWSNNLVTISIVVGLSSTVAFFLFDYFSGSLPAISYGILMTVVGGACAQIFAARNKLSELISNKNLTSSERDRLVPQIKARERGYSGFAVAYLVFAAFLTCFAGAVSAVGGHKDVYSLKSFFDPLMVGLCFATAYSYLVHLQDLSEIHIFLGKVEDRINRDKSRDDFVARRKKKAS